MITTRVNGKGNSDDEKADKSKKSNLSLPVETINETPLPNPDRFKLSVQGLMGFADRRRSSGAFLSEITRKMSINTVDGFGTRSSGKEKTIKI